MNGPEKLQGVIRLAQELQGEDNPVIVQSRIEGLAKELGVNPYQCALIYWALNMAEDFKDIWGEDTAIKFRAK